MRFEVVFWCLEWECCSAFFKRLMKIHTNPPILCYGFKNSKWNVYTEMFTSERGILLCVTHTKITSPADRLRLWCLRLLSSWHHLHRVIAHFCRRSGHIAAINKLSRGGRGGDICSQSMKRLGKCWMILNIWFCACVYCHFQAPALKTPNW